MTNYPYTTAQYAQAFTDNKPLELPHSQRWILQRAIGNTPYNDLLACYPRFPLASLPALEKDLANLTNQQWVTLTLVSDAILIADITLLPSLFDLARPFKQHYLHSPDKPIAFSKHHRYEIKQALQHCTIREINFADYLEPWCALYQRLVTRHQVTGLLNFNHHYFQQLAAMKNLITRGAFDRHHRLIGMHLWFQDNAHLYSHLAANNEAGYESGAAYAIYNSIIQEFGSTHTIDFGSAAGHANDPQNGLTRFKKGFANHSAWSYLCGKILNKEHYRLLTGTDCIKPDVPYFPPYHRG